MTPDRRLPGIFVALGSNVGDRLGHLKTALGLMQEAGIRILKCSSVYDTDPLGPAQADYLNAVCLVESHLSPGALLAALQKIEREIGRRDRQRWGPREIDLDILLYGDHVIDSADLTVPHPELLKRSFVLVPLSEIAPDLKLPDGARVSDFLSPPGAGVRRYREGRL